MINEEQKYVEKQKAEFEKYCQQLICMGFHSAKYYINLNKICLIKHLIPEKGNETYTFKRNNSYACMSTPKFKFLDITKYLTPGIKIFRVLACFRCPRMLRVFPYQFLDSVEKLDYPSTS